MSVITKELLNQVEVIARAAGDAIMDIYGREFNIEQKADNSPLTEADAAAHNLIVNQLPLLSLQAPILSEEAPEHFAGADANGRYWLVDPLDGTQEFIAGSGDFSTMIALMEHGKPVLGVVFGPVNNLLYYAVRGVGAFKEIDGQVLPMRASHYLASQPLPALRITVSLRQNVDWVRARLTTDLEYELVPLGSSSLKSCLVADGGADIYMRIGPTGEWDTGATQCIVEEAGGRIVDLYLNPLSYNQRHTLINPNFITMGDPTLDWSKILINPAGNGDN